MTKTLLVAENKSVTGIVKEIIIEQRREKIGWRKKGEHHLQSSWNVGNTKQWQESEGRDSCNYNYGKNKQDTIDVEYISKCDPQKHKKGKLGT